MAAYVGISRWFSLAFGGAGMWLGAERWLWYRKLPRFSAPRLCGNCFLTAVGMPHEIGLLGLILVSRSIMGVDWNRDDIPWLYGALIGVYSTPAVVGLPIFVICFLALISPVIKMALRKTFVVLKNRVRPLEYCDRPISHLSGSRPTTSA
jgi:hypothetical protein